MILNIFTNSKKGHFDIITETYYSFVETFGEIPIKIYCDTHPDQEYFEEYKDKLQTYFNADVIKTRSLSDGYIKSIEESDEDYLFQLEHDWTFQNVNHSLDEILEVIKEKGIWYFKFSGNPNVETSEGYKWQNFIREKEYDGFKYCETDNLSNRPHIIDREYYLNNMLDKIERRTGTFGIEQNIQAQGYQGCAYGGLNHPPTTKHINPAGDGRNASDKSKKPNKKL